jgi:hypothetical protein
MGRLQEISPQQNVVNKINAKADFTHNINRTRLERYTVSTKNVFTGKNPSQLLGGWLSEDDIYFLDYGLSVSDIKEAMKIAKFNKQLAIYDNIANKVIPVAD